MSAARAEERRRAARRPARARHAAPVRRRPRRAVAWLAAGLASTAVVWLLGWVAPSLAGRQPAGARSPMTMLGTLAPGDRAPSAPGVAGQGSSARSAAQGTADRRVAQMTAGMPAGSVSIAALDTVTGARYTYGVTSDMTMGSVAKLLVLEACLLQQQDERRAAAEWELEDLAAMMVNSDNDAADELYAGLGGDLGMTTATQRLGLTSTTVQASDHWGLGTTSATDQLQLLQELVGARSSLLAASRDFALGLMRAVEDDQRWGVGAVADPGTSFANKNGWLGLDDDDGRWLVNSLGVLSVRGHQVLMVVLTQHDEDVAEGINLTESLAATAVTGLGLD